MSEKKSSAVRRRVCRVAASMTIKGEQDTLVQMGSATTGEPAVAVRIGTMLIHVEDTRALTSLVEAIIGASVVSDRIFGEDRRHSPSRSIEVHAAATVTMHERLSTGSRGGIAPGQPPRILCSHDLPPLHA